MNRDIVFLRSTFEQCISSLRQGSGRIFLDTTLNWGKGHTQFLVNDLVISSRPPDPRRGHYIFELKNSRRLRASRGVCGQLCLQQSDHRYYIQGRFTNPKSGQPEDLDCIKVIGFPMILIPTDSGEIDLVPNIQREREALGNAAAIISMLSCAIIGCGKTGFPIFMQLLDRVREIVVVDYQVIERENLAFLEASKSFLGKPKVDYFKARAESSSTRVVPIFGDATDPRVLEQLKAADVIFLSCDRTLPRLTIAIFGQQYLIPVIDVGVAVRPSGRGRVGMMMGQVQVFLSGPDHGCVFCLHGFNMAQALRESMSPFEERLAKARGVLGQEEPYAAIKSFSSAVALQAVLEFNNLYSGVKEFHQFVRVDGLSENPVSYLPNRRADPQCPVCGRQGIVAAGDSLPLPDPHRGALRFTIPKADGPSGTRRAGRARSQTPRSSTTTSMANRDSQHSNEGSDDLIDEFFYGFYGIIAIAFLAASIFGFSVLIRWLLDLNISDSSLWWFSITASGVSAIIFFIRRAE